MTVNIDERPYDTITSRAVGRWLDTPHEDKPDSVHTLYQTCTGAFFVHKQVSRNGRRVSETFAPISLDAARLWLFTGNVEVLASDVFPVAELTRAEVERAA